MISKPLRMCLNWILRWKSCAPFLLLHCISTSTNLSFMLSMTALWYDSHRGVIARKSSTSSLVHQNIYSLRVDVIVFPMMCIIFNLISYIQTIYLWRADVEFCRILGLSLNVIEISTLCVLFIGCSKLGIGVYSLLSQSLIIFDVLNYVCETTEFFTILIW